MTAKKSWPAARRVAQLSGYRADKRRIIRHGVADYVARHSVTDDSHHRVGSELVSSLCGVLGLGTRKTPAVCHSRGSKERYELSTYLAGGATDGGSDRRERLVGVAAQGRDCSDANHDDEGEHDGIFDRGRAIFTLDEFDDKLAQLLHFFTFRKPGYPTLGHAPGLDPLVLRPRLTTGLPLSQINNQTHTK